MGVTCLYTPFKKEFEPIVRVGENIAIPKGAEEYEYYKVLYIEPIQPMIVGVDLTASEQKHSRKLTEIELEDNEAGQWRMKVLDFVKVDMNHPAASAKWVTKSARTSATPLSPDNLLEFYTVKDDVPTLYLTNPLAEPQTVRVMIWGFKYSIKKLDHEPSEYTVFPAYSAPYVVGGTGR